MKISVLILLVAISAASAKSYDGYKVLRVVPRTFRAKAMFGDLKHEFNILKTLPGDDTSYDVLLSPAELDVFEGKMKALNIEFLRQIEDLQKLITDERIANDLARSKSLSGQPRIDNTYYRTLDEINDEMANFAAKFPNLMTRVSIGLTFEGRDTYMLKISSGGSGSKPLVWTDCGIHAREWVTDASCLFFMDQLSTYGTDPDITTLVDTYDFYILPVANPDGYAWTWSDDRLWRKNRRTPVGACWGVDLNRNFDSCWSCTGASGQPCSETYYGTSAFSEPETQNIRDAINAENGRIAMLFSIHSYSQLWMYPYGYTTAPTADAAELDRVSAAGVSALTAVYGTEYEYGPIAVTIYEASGGSIDWTYDSAGIVYSFTQELRDTGEYGFILPADQIEPTATESWAGLVGAINALP